MGNWVGMGTLGKPVQVSLRRELVGLDWQSQYLNMVLGDGYNWFFEYIFIQEIFNFYSVKSITQGAEDAEVAAFSTE